MENFHKETESISDVASKLKAIIETALDGIITIDERGLIEVANPATCTLFGYDVSEMLGQNINMLMPTPYHENHDKYIHNYRETGVRKIIGIGREVQGKKKDGTVFPFWLSISEVKLESKRLFTGIVHDLTEQKKAEHALMLMNKNLEGLVSERTDKLSDVVNKLLSTNQQLQHEISERKAAELAALMSKDELRRIQELLQQIVSSYPDGSISVVNRDFNYLFTGGEIHKTLGINDKELMGKRLFPLVSLETWAQIQPDLERVFEGETLQDYEIPEVIQDYQIGRAHV